ncbi:uncharacterized protein JCM6883_000214 [Sporobolomyces salmoneus]|uniref:uncharacterized protein n=1 Tax=Sporobolomyces salmoneus TaxID=183962 RepID=UPI0031777AC7
MSQPPFSAAPSSSARQTDVRKRTVLPTTLQNLRSTTSSAGSTQIEVDGLTSDEYLDRLEEELNRKLDGELEGLVEGFKELVALARIDPLTSHPSQASLRSAQSRLRTHQILRNAHQLLSMSHQLKLLHLFGDLETGSKGREERERELGEEIRAQRERVEKMGERLEGEGMKD